MTITILRASLDSFMAKALKLNKRLEKYGKSIKILSLHDSMKTIEGKDCCFTTIEIEAPLLLRQNSPVQYLGMKTYVDGIKVFYSTDKENPVHTIDREECDHCHTKRYRLKYFFFKVEGEVKVIGSSCVKEYFGMDVERYLDTYTNVMQELEEEFGGEGQGGGSRSRLVHIDDVILATYCATNGFKYNWVSKEKAHYDNIPTTDLVRNYLYTTDKIMNQEKDEAYKVLKDQFSSIKEKLYAKYRDKEVVTDFDANIRNNLFYPDGTERDFIICVGLVGWLCNDIQHPREEESSSKPSEWVGEENEKIEKTVKIIQNAMVNSNYGQSFIVLMEDEVGNKLKTFTTGAFSNVCVGESVKIKGTIKRHEAYRGIKTTLLTRVSKI